MYFTFMGAYQFELTGRVYSKKNKKIKYEKNLPNSGQAYAFPLLAFFPLVPLFPFLAIRYTPLAKS